MLAKPTSFKHLFLIILIALLGLTTPAFSQDEQTGGNNFDRSPLTFEPSVPIKDRVKAVAPSSSSGNSGAYALFRVYVFKVHRGEGDVAFLASNGGGAVGISEIRKFNFGVQTGYKTEAGWNAANGFGFRGAYFYTKQDAREAFTANPGVPAFYSPRPLNVEFTGAASANTPADYEEQLRLDVGDLEGTYKWNRDNWSVLASAGLRVARVSQVYTANDTSGAATETLIYSQKRTGIGPTGAVDLRRKLGDSSLWLTGSARFAEIFGTVKENSDFLASNGFSQTAARESSPRTFVFEGETGLEWDHKFSGGHEFFFNGQFIFHNWNKLVIQTPVNSIGGNPLSALDSPTAPPTQHGNVSFLGGSFSVGFRF